MLGRGSERAHLVQVEPVRSATAERADFWLPARPGTETLLALGLGHVLVAERLVDPRASGRARDLADYAALVARVTPETVAAVTGRRRRPRSPPPRASSCDRGRRSVIAGEDAGGGRLGRVAETAIWAPRTAPRRRGEAGGPRPAGRAAGARSGRTSCAPVRAERGGRSLRGGAAGRRVGRRCRLPVGAGRAEARGQGCARRRAVAVPRRYGEASRPGGPDSAVPRGRARAADLVRCAGCDVRGCGAARSTAPRSCRPGRVHPRGRRGVRRRLPRKLGHERGAGEGARHADPPQRPREPGCVCGRRGDGNRGRALPGGVLDRFEGGRALAGRAAGTAAGDGVLAAWRCRRGAGPRGRGRGHGDARRCANAPDPVAARAAGRDSLGGGVAGAHQAVLRVRAAPLARHRGDQPRDGRDAGFASRSDGRARDAGRQGSRDDHAGCRRDAGRGRGRCRSGRERAGRSGSRRRGAASWTSAAAAARCGAKALRVWWRRRWKALPRRRPATGW